MDQGDASVSLTSIVSSQTSLVGWLEYSGSNRQICWVKVPRHPWVHFVAGQTMKANVTIVFVSDQGYNSAPLKFLLSQLLFQVISHSCPQFPGIQFQMWSLMSTASLLLFRRSACNPMNCSPPCSSVHRISKARTLEWVAFLLQGIFLTQGLNPQLLHWQADSLPLSHQRSPLHH